MIPTFFHNLNRGGQWLARQLAPVGLWLIVFGLVANLISNAVTIQSCRDVIRNEKETATGTNAFLNGIARGEENRLSGDSAYIAEFRAAMASIQKEEHERLSGDAGFVAEFRKTTRERDEKLDRIYRFLTERFGYLSSPTDG